MMIPAAVSVGNPPLSPQYCGFTANLRTYAGNVGDVVVVQDYDVATLLAAGWIRLPDSGTTAQRPQRAAFDFVAGAYFNDTTIGKLIVFDGVAWRDPVTGAVV